MFKETILASLMMITVVAYSKNDSSNFVVKKLKKDISAASKESPVPTFKMTPILNVVGGDKYVCILGEDNVKCWGMPYDPVPEDLKFPLTLSSANGQVCASGIGGVKCWGATFNTLQTFLSRFKHPRNFVISNSYGMYAAYDVCVLESGAVNCWNSNDYKVDVPSFTSATEIGAGGGYMCGIENGKVKCGEGQCGIAYKVPRYLNNSRNLKVSSFHACVMTNDGIECWGSDRDSLGCASSVPGIEQLKLTNPRSLTSGRYHTCAIGDEGIKCIGMNTEGQLDVPEGLKNPTALYAVGERTCAVTDDGVVCWGKKILDKNNNEVTIPADPLQ